MRCDQGLDYEAESIIMEMEVQEVDGCVVPCQFVDFRWSVVPALILLRLKNSAGQKLIATLRSSFTSIRPKIRISPFLEHGAQLEPRLFSVE